MLRKLEKNIAYECENVQTEDGQGTEESEDQDDETKSFNQPGSCLNNSYR